MRRQFYVIDFWIPPLKPAPGSKRGPWGRSGGPAINFRASFDKKVLLGIVRGDTYKFRSFGSHPHFQLQALKNVHRLDPEASVLSFEHIFIRRYCWEEYNETFSCYEFWLQPSLPA